MQNCCLRIILQAGITMGLWLFCGFVFAQNRSVVDSLEKQLTKYATKDSVKIGILVALSKEYRTSNPDKALALAKKGLEIADKSGFTWSQALCNNHLGSTEILRGDYVQASFHLQKGLILCEKVKDRNLLAEILNNLGTVYQHESNYQAALTAYKKSMDIRVEIDDKSGVASCHNNMGMIYEKQGHYTKALEHFFISLKIKETFAKPQTIANTLSNIGRVYNHLENEKSSLEYHFRALKIRLGVNEKYGTSISLYEIGKVHQNLGDITKATDYYNQSLTLQHEIKYQPGLVDNYRQLGEIYFSQRKYDSARRYLEKSQKLAEQIADKEGLAHALTKLAALFMKTNQIQRAMFYAQHSLQMAKNMHSLNLMRENYFVLYEIHKKTKQNDKALYFYELGISMQDSLLDEDKHLELYKLQTDYELDRREAKIKLLDKDKKIQEEELLLRTVERNLITGIVFLLACFLLFLFFRVREKQRANILLNQQKTEILERSEVILQQQEELTTQNESLLILNNQVSEQKQEIEQMNVMLESKIVERTEELEEAIEVLGKQNEDLEQFAYIVSHNLRSPITQILGLTSLFTTETNQENVELIKMLQSSAQNLDVVITDLNHVLDIKGQHTKTYEDVNLTEIVEKIAQKFENQLHEFHATLQINVNCINSTIYVIKEYAENVLSQYIANAIKYRNIRKDLMVKIKLYDNEKYIIVSVSDNGLGIFDTKKIFRLYQRQHVEIEGKGLNLFLVKTQMEVLDGMVSVESEEGKGSVFSAYFKKKEI